MNHPVIIIGMHRSGTSLVARLLDKLGLFIGLRRDENDEALFFSRLNSWVLSACGGRWDNPRCIDHLYADPAGVELVVDYLSRASASIRCLEFLGAGRYLKHGSVFRLTEPWGWKDPRSTLTLPLWLAVFPQAKVLHVVRNGIDVALSLRKRQQQGFEAAKRRYEAHPGPAVLRGKRGWFGVSPRVQDAGEGVTLWGEYLEYAERFAPADSARFKEVRYEDLLLSPEETLKTLADYCGLQASGRQVASLCAGINRSRAYGNQHDPAFAGLRDAVGKSNWFDRYGYDIEGPGEGSG